MALFEQGVEDVARIGRLGEVIVGAQFNSLYSRRYARIACQISMRILGLEERSGWINESEV